jgi:amino acid adenylation domain-containing protein
MASRYSTAKQELLEKYLRGDLEFRPPAQPIPRHPSNQSIPLSFAQEQIWLHAQLVPDLPLYNEPVTIHYSGALDVAALEKAFNEVVRRHEAWRTCFKLLDGQPVQDVKQNLAISLPVVDLRTLPQQHRDAAALVIATQDGRRPLNLGEAPLFRVRLIRLEDQEYRLYLTLSHIIFDGVAIYRVFLPELAALYRAYAAGEPSPLGELTLQYPDFAAWQRQSLRDDALNEQIAYWKKQLGPELPVLDLPLDRPRPPVQTFRGSMHPFVLSGDLTAALRRVSGLEGVTLFQTLLAGFAALLCRYSGQTDFPMGSVTAGRDRPELNSLLGYFLNTVVLRADLSADPSFRELVKRIRNVTLEALEHDSVPWGRLVQELSPTWDRSRNPLFQVMFSLEPPMPDVDPAWRLTQMDVDTGATKYDLYLELDERRDAVLARFHYSTDLFDQSTIAQMARHWVTLLEGVSGDPGLRVSQLPLLSESEKHQVLVEWNETQSEFPQAECIHQRFVAQARQTPNAAAIREGDREFTFAYLQERSNRLAHYLRGIGAGPGNRIALCVERSLDMVVGLIGILKTGAAYVPLDTSYPHQWLAFVLEDSGASVVVTSNKLARKLPFHRAETLCLDGDWESSVGQLEDDPPSNSRPDDPAYVLYTSGSTGTPKGVEGTHRGCMNRLAWMWREYPFAAGEVCCQKTNLGFVDSVWEIFGPLLAGVANVIIAAETVLDPEGLLEVLKRERVTRIVLVPSLLRMLLEHDWRLGERVPELRLWTCSGEVLPVELVERFRAGFAGARLLNLYGSAEVAADVTCHEVTEADERAPSVLIGKPISNLQVYILDEGRNAVPVGVRGEIYVGGEGLARGYWRRPELTGERFVANPIAGQRSPRLYRTGDVGRWRANGEIEYVGRVDNQVKVRGMRIELGEIEAVLGTHPQVKQAVVGVSGEGEQQRLQAYVQSGNGQGPTAGELRRYVRGKLPEHMVPTSYRRVEGWPLLPSGKVDRKAVAGMGGVALAEGEGGGGGPRTEVEKKLAGMWQELLKVEGIGVEQNFFELGGHSLLALQVMARIRNIFEVELPVRSLFEAGTIGGLAVAVEEARRQGRKVRTPIVARKGRGEKASPEALLAQLDQMSSSELQSLLQRVLDGKPPA